MNMKYAIVYASKTGNTKLLVDEIQHDLQEYTCVYCGAPNIGIETDVMLLGSWINQGTFAPELLDYMRSLHKQKIFLFGTAGFGGSKEYFEGIIQRTKAVLDDSNIVLGSFMCQGRMPETVKQRYLTMLETNPGNAQIKGMLENYEQAMTHPDAQDLQDLHSCLTVVRNEA